MMGQLGAHDNFLPPQTAAVYYPVRGSRSEMFDDLFLLCYLPLFYFINILYYYSYHGSRNCL